MKNNTGKESKDTHNTGTYSIRREDNKYNKYMKWHLEYYYDTGERLSSEWFKTQKEARQRADNAIYRGRKGFHIGDYVSFTEYTEIS